MPEQLDLGIKDTQSQLTDTWQGVLRIASELFRRPVFEGFIQGLTPLRVEEDRLVLAAPSALVKRFVEEKYAHTLQDAVDECFGRPLKLVVTVAGTNGAKPHAASAKLVKTPQKPAPVAGSLPLNERFTFENFVVGQCNRLAYAAAMAVASSPKGGYNPLFIYGGPGLGKTHLMQAVGNHLCREHPDKRVMFISGEAFTVQFVAAIQQRRMEEFRSRCRGVDVFIIDDIQFIASKESTEEEFVHTFNALYQSDRQIVIASDRSPRELYTSENRLRSRFEAGLMVDLKPPDLETRMAILRHKAALERVDVPQPVIEYIASLVKSNVRVLEGALVKVIASASIMRREINVELADEVLGYYFREHDAKPIEPKDIQQAVCRELGVTMEELLGSSRRKAVVIARQIAMHLVRELTSASLPEIGRLFGGKDHSTVIHACSKAKSILRDDPQLSARVRALADSLRS
ncbi:MAG: chromosomal replication initiator protein DnaA [Armatimonadota bacterium]